MGVADTVTKAYMRKNNIFADAFNYLIYNGEPVVNPGELTEVDTTELILPYAMPVRNMIYDALQYGKQVADIAHRHRNNERNSKEHSKTHSKGEFLSGFYKYDLLKPERAAAKAGMTVEQFEKEMENISAVENIV